MRNMLLIMTFCLTLSACASGPQPQPDVIYRAIPEALTQPCTLPSVPEDTADLSDAFVQAYKCGELGNSDKAAIRDLLTGNTE